MKISQEQTISLLQSENLVALPADTLYGLSAPFQSISCVEKILSLKKREPEKPFILLVSSFEELEFLTQAIDQENILKNCFPGFNTFIFWANTDKIPAIVRGFLPTVAIRIPVCPYLQTILQKTGPLITTSINQKNKSPANSIKEIEELLGGNFPIFPAQNPLLQTPSSVINTTLTPWKFERKTKTSKKIFSLIEHMLQCG